MTQDQLIDEAIALAFRYGGIDGAHHKQWVIDQMVRCLLGCPKDDNGGYVANETYVAMVIQANDGEDGPDTYAWDEGIAP